jgi:hypothetical protein
LKGEHPKNVRAAADRVIASIRERLGKPLEGAIAALTRLGDANLDAKAEAHLISELSDLDDDLFRSLTDPARRVRRLRNTLEMFERRIGESS